MLIIHSFMCLIKYLSQKQQYKIEDVIDAQSYIECKDYISESYYFGDPGTVELNCKPRYRRHYRCRQNAFYQKSQRNIRDDRSHKRIYLIEASAAEQDHRAYPVYDIKYIQQTQSAAHDIIERV